MVFAAVVANIAANAVVAALLPRLSTVCYGDAKPGIIGGLLWLLSMRLLPQWDVSNTILVEVCFCLLTARDIRRRASSAWALGAGALGGLLLLLNPATALVIIPWVVWLFVSERVSWRFATAYSSVAALAMTLTLAPWLVRNYRTWGTLTLRNSFGLTLYVSNNDCAESSLYREMESGCIQSMYPSTSETEAHLVRALGEVQYDFQRREDALRWISSHHKRFAELTAARVVDFWFPVSGLGAYGSHAIWAITVLSIPGIILTIKRREAIRYLILFVWVIYPLIYYVLVSCDRYRYPILWTSLLPAGYALSVMASAVAGRRRSIFQSKDEHEIWGAGER
jgi:4-amino-4-deoxy-L-arabinose transferase-like glycosyltransferase